MGASPAFPFETDVWRMPDDQVEAKLLTGEDERELEDYFGLENYRELRQLKLDTTRRVSRGGPRVLVMPGIMGSKLGRKRFLLDDTIWLDPIGIANGDAVKLALKTDGPGDIRALGVFLFAYLKLKLRLSRAGYDADFYPYDWRLSIETLGKNLAKYIAAQPGHVSIVAHSMGGLVARAAIEQGARVKRFIMLGTPNGGSFSPVLALRSLHPLVAKLDRLDRKHTADQLVRNVFASFPGLTQMLPSPELYTRTDYFDMSAWPTNRTGPREKILEDARNIETFLAPADERFFLIAGVNQRTIVGERLEDGKYKYEENQEGDGTVPLAFARLPDAKTYYVEEEHGKLPNNGTVFNAVRDLLETGATTVLSDTAPTFRGGATTTIPESAIVENVAFGSSRGGAVRAEDLRNIAREFAAPDDSAGAAPAAAVVPAVAVSAGATGDAGFAHHFDRFTVGRFRQHRISVQLANTSITSVEARAYVVGLFHAVTPSGPAAAIDQWLDGAIKEFTQRRMFSGAVGEVFMMPAARRQLRADFVLFAGLGLFDQFSSQVQELVAENVIRTLIRTRVEDFATVLFGGNSGQSVERSLRNLLTGFIRGLIDADDGHRFRCLTLCETDPARYELIKQELFRLSSTQLFSDIEVTFCEYDTTIPSAELTMAPADRLELTGRPDPVYLLVRREPSNAKLVFSSAVLTAGAKATVIQDQKVVDPLELEAFLAKIESKSFVFKGLSEYGEALAKLVLAEAPARVLATMKGRHLVVVHDSEASRIPWETISLDGWTPATDVGLSHRYMTANLSVAKYLESARERPLLEMLLIINPTEDLEGAEEEGNRILARFNDSMGMKITPLRGADATKPAVLSAIQSERFDVLHYAGHAFFDPIERSRSGLHLAEEQVLSGADLASIGNLPTLMFFNACESARVRKKADLAKRNLDLPKRVERTASLAEAFLRGGVANYVGTYWAVNDAAALSFSEMFYGAILRGRSIGEALLEGRRKLLADKQVDWADYVHYGNHSFVVKRKRA